MVEFVSVLVWVNAGFMFGTSVLDKDGVSGAACMAELVIYLATQGLTLVSHLDKLYQRLSLGLYESSLSICLFINILSI
jgi:phosphomannomutase